MSVNEVEQERKNLYKWIFVIATACGIIATILVAKRSASLIGELHAKMHVDNFWFSPGTPTNPILSVGQQLTGLVRTTNRGALPVQNLSSACELTISPVLAPRDEDRLFDQLAIDQKERLAQPNGNEVLQGDNQEFGCVTKDRTPITKEQFDKLTSVTGGNLTVVYVTILMRYKDKLGKDLTTENCWHVYMGLPDKPLDCLNHNR